MRYLLVLVTLSFLILASCSGEEKSSSQKKVVESKLMLDTAGADLSYLSFLHKRKNFKNYDASLVQYIRANPNRPDSIRKVIYLQPLGDMSPEVEAMLPDEAEYLKAFFQLEVKLLPAIPFNDLKKMDSVQTRRIPDYRNQYYGKSKGENPNLMEQVEAKSLMKHYLIANKPKDAVAVLGITDHDMYMAKMNYIFGLSQAALGVGIVSTHRITDNPHIAQLNVRKAVSKQIVNLFSIPNVKDYICVVNYHNSVEELDNGVLYISPVALSKLKVNIGFDYEKRFIALRDYWKKQEPRYTFMADYYDRCLNALYEHRKKIK